MARKPGDRAQEEIGKLPERQRRLIRAEIKRAGRKAATIATAVTATVTLAGPPAVHGIESLVSSGNTASAIDTTVTNPIATIAIDDANRSFVTPPSSATSAIDNGLPLDATGAMRTAIKVAKDAEKLEGSGAGPLTEWAAKQPLNGNPSTFLQDAQPAISLSKQEAGVGGSGIGG